MPHSANVLDIMQGRMRGIKDVRIKPTFPLPCGAFAAQARPLLRLSQARYGARGECLAKVRQFQ